MPKRIFGLVFFMLLSVAALAGPDGIEIRLVKTDTLKLIPGASTNIVIQLINNTLTDQEILLKISSPQGWKCLTNTGVISVAKTSKKLKILSLYIPEFTVSGDYKVTVTAIHATGNQIIGMVAVPVFVQPNYELLVSADQASGYVVSGDSVNVKFMVQNLSNVKVNIRTTLKSKTKSENQLFTLAPDSFVYVTKTIVTETGLIYYTKENVSLEAIISENPEIKSITYQYFDVVPSNKIRFDAYDRFAVKLSPLFISNNRSGGREYAAMFDIRGTGILNKEKVRTLDFHFRGPNRTGKSLMGIYDEKYINYASPHSTIRVGDNNYSLSYLTEFSRYGTGMSYEHRFNKIMIGSFINYPRFYPQVKREFSFYTGYISEKKYSFNAGYLNKQFRDNTRSQLFTVSGMATLFSKVDLETEYATSLSNGNLSHAYKTAVKANFSLLRLYFNYTNADKNFQGYFSNSKYLSTSVSATITKKINLNLNYNFNHNNIALDTLFSNAPFSDNLSLSANYGINKNTGVNVSLNRRDREDRMEPKKFNYKEYTARIAVNKKIQQVDFNLWGETGKTTDLLKMAESQITNMYRANFNLKVPLNDQLFISGFVTYNKQQQFKTFDNRSWYYGGALDAKMGKKGSITFNYQNNYEIEQYYKDRSILSLNMNYQISRNNEIGSGLRYNLTRNTMNQRELEVMVRYAHTINVPVRKKKDMGSLTGKVINKGVENVEGVVFNLDGKIAISDKSGFFKFPVLKKGIQYLMVDYSNAGIYAIAETPGPYKLDITSGADDYFEITLTKSARINGTLVIVDDENKGVKGFVAVKTKLNRLIIEAKKGNEIFRVLTDEKGSFSFEGLRPGNWSVQVYKNGISKEYELLTEFFSLNLEPGHYETIEVRVKEKQRRIKFQNSVDLIKSGK